MDIAQDRALIERLGGPARVAQMLGYNKQRGGTQRVHNWMSRGIPAAVKVDHPALFLNEPAGNGGTAQQQAAA